MKFFSWAYDNGDKMSDDLDYVPMPKAVKEMVAKQWATMKDTAGRPIALK